MKNILKWFAGFLIVMILVAGLKMAKFSLLRPPDMDNRMADYDASPDGPPWQNGPFHPNEHELERHPPFGEPPHAGMEWSFVLADLIDLLVYALILLPLFYAAYLLGKRTLHLPRLNSVSEPRTSSFKVDQSPVERDPVAASQSDYLGLDNHMFDQLL